MEGFTCKQLRKELKRRKEVAEKRAHKKLRKLLHEEDAHFIDIRAWAAVRCGNYGLSYFDPSTIKYHGGKRDGDNWTILTATMWDINDEKFLFIAEHWVDICEIRRKYIKAIGH
jgi:hypothetical protein